jgi:hypothetical protein
LQRVTASPELRQKERLGWADKLLSMRRDSLNNGTDKEGTGEGNRMGRKKEKVCSLLLLTANKINFNPSSVILVYLSLIPSVHILSSSFTKLVKSF